MMDFSIIYPDIDPKHVETERSSVLLSRRALRNGCRQIRRVQSAAAFEDATVDKDGNTTATKRVAIIQVAAIGAKLNDVC